MPTKTSSEYNQPLTYRLSYGTDPLQFGKLYLPGGIGNYPVAMLIHGGFWRNPYDLTLMRPLAHDLVQRGIAVWNIEYRRIGDPGGAWPGTLLDVAEAADYLHTITSTYRLDPLRIITIGHSAGGHLAFWLAVRRMLSEGGPLKTTYEPLALRGAISLAGVLDLLHSERLHLGKHAACELLGGKPTTVPDRYQAASPAAHLPLGIPQILVHGTADDRVPLIVSHDYAKKARAVGDQITLIEVPDADHFDVIDPASSAWRQTLTAMQEILQIP